MITKVKSSAKKTTIFDKLDEWYEGLENTGYEQFYSSGSLGFISKIMHKLLEIRFSKNYYFDITLELGAGHGQHFKYVKHGYSKYIMSDIRLKNLQKNFDMEPTTSVELRKIDATNITNLKDDSINRLVVTCLLAHLDDPLNVLTEWKRIINKKKGNITIYVPMETGFMTQLARRLLIWPRSKKSMRYDPELLCYYEHKNGYLQLDKFIHHVFEDYSIKELRFPFSKLYWQFSLFSVYSIDLST